MTAGTLAAAVAAAAGEGAQGDSPEGALERALKSAEEGQEGADDDDEELGLDLDVLVPPVGCAAPLLPSVLPHLASLDILPPNPRLGASMPFAELAVQLARSLLQGPGI